MTKETKGADFKSATDPKKLFIETYGCQMNVADSEVVASIMQMAGYSVCDSLDEADARKSNDMLSYSRRKRKGKGKYAKCKKISN